VTDIDFKNVSMSDVFPEVDEKKTRQKVASFLSRTLPRMVRITSKSLTELRSQRLDGMPKASSSDNDSDRRIVQHLYAEQVVKQVKQAISQCDQESQNILNMLYFKGYSDTQCYMALGRSGSSYSHLYKPQALLEFADCYFLDDLHIYQAE